jgi:DNA-binding SARP family transcriptional activator/predicted ATPase
MLEIRFLGQYRVSFDGQAIDIPSRPAKLLLAYLLLNPGKEHRREKVAGVLWPESTEANARNNLRQALWRIRKTLSEVLPEGKDLLIGDGSHIDIDHGEDHWVDVIALESEVGEDWTPDMLQENLTLYKGELLPGFYEDWIMLRREQVQASFERKMGVLLERLLHGHRWHEVLEWGERWIALGSVPELAFRALMIAHAEKGDVSSAASMYHRCVDSLQDELGVEPSEETKQIYERLLKGEKLLRPSIHEGAEIAGFSTWQAPSQVRFPPFIESELDVAEEARSTFVAREGELAHLDGLLEKVFAGNGQLVFITGEAGSGKTALIKAFAKRAQEKNPDLLFTFGGGNALTGIGDPYLPFRQALGLLTGDIESQLTGGAITLEQARRLWIGLPIVLKAITEEGTDLLNSFLNTAPLISRAKSFNPDAPEWAAPLEQVLDRKDLEVKNSSIDQSDLFSQYSQVLRTISSDRPLLLALDDLQWTDTGSVNLLFHLGRSIDHSQIMIIGAYRPAELTTSMMGGQHPLSKVVGEFKRLLGETQIDLGEFEEAEGKRFISALLDAEPNRLGGDFRQALFKHTNGHPLFAVELLRALEARGDIYLDAGEVWVESPVLDWEVLPVKIEGVIEERISRLDANSQKLLTVASVEGEDFTAELIAQILKMEASEVIECLSEELSRRHRLVSAQGSLRWRGQRLSRYRFRHVLFVTHLYNKLDEVERTHLHEEMGNLLEDLYGEESGEIAVQLARHFAEAGVPEKAIEYLEVAGSQAKQLSANEEAIVHISRAIELLHHLPASQGRTLKELEMQISLGAPLIVTMGYGAPEVEAVFNRAKELSQHVEEPLQLFTVMYGLRSYFLMRAEHRIAREITEKLIELAEVEHDPSLLLMAYEAKGTTLFYLGDLDEAHTTLQRGMEIYDPEQHGALAFLFGQDPGVTCMSYSALTLWSLGSPEEASIRNQDAIRLARQVGHPFSLALALNFAALLNALCQEGEAALRYSLESMEISAKHKFPVWQAAGEILSGWSMAQSGEVESGLARMYAGLDSWQATGAILGRPFFLALLAEALRLGHRIEESLDVTTEALEVIRKSGEKIHQAALQRLRGELLEHLGED